MDQRWTKIRQLFRAALDVDVKQREAFLMEQCPDDQEIRDRVATMLSAYDNDDTFLESPIANFAQRTSSTRGHEALVGKKVGSYLIRRVIAQGGMGVVFEALDTMLDKIVALKMMNPALMQDLTFKRRFEQEAKTLAKLEDPHFVRVNALIEENHNTFIVMEYVQGFTLAEHIRSKGKLGPREVARIGLQLLTALSKAHKQNIIHRDLKPSNIMLTRSDDGRMLVKVLDFGIAKNVQGSNAVTRTMGTVGTLFYMSPEQVRALPEIDHRTDIYSTGVTLTEALNGSLPFDITKDEFTIRKQIVEGHLTPKSTPTTAVERVLARAMEIDPVQRYQSADHMRAELLNAIREYTPDPGSPPQPQAPIPQFTPRPDVHLASPPPKKKRSWIQFALPAVAALVLAPIILYATTGNLIPFLKQAPASTEIIQAPLDSETSGEDEQNASSISLDTSSTEPVAIPSEVQDDSLTIVQDEAVLNIQPDTTPEDILDATPEELPDSPAIVDNTLEESLESTQQETADSLGIVNNTPVTLPEVPDSTLPNSTDSSNDTTEPLLSEPPPQFGTITMLVQPPGNLIVDDTDYGPIVVEPLNLTADYHRFTVQNREFGSWECTMFVPANESIEKYVIFDQTISIPVVAMQPDGTIIRNASIILDGTPTGSETPQAVQVYPGLHSFSAQLEGYTQVDIQIDGAEACFQKVNNRINFDSGIEYRDKRVIIILEAIK